MRGRPVLDRGIEESGDTGEQRDVRRPPCFEKGEYFHRESVREFGGGKNVAYNRGRESTEGNQ